MQERRGVLAFNDIFIIYAFKCQLYVKMAFAKFYNKSYLLFFYEGMGRMTFFLMERKQSYYENVKSVFVFPIQ